MLQAPSLQVAPAKHWMPQPPQLFSSLSISVSQTKSPVQLAVPSAQALGVRPHTPPLQVRVAFGAPGQALPQAPQASTLDRSVSQPAAPVQSSKPGRQLVPHSPAPEQVAAAFGASLQATASP